VGNDPDDVETNARSFRPAPERAPSEVPTLAVIGGGSRGRVIPIAAGRSKIGRASSAFVQLHDDGVSRYHVEITLDGDGMVTVRDLGSTNGTFVNGARIERVMLREGDRIQIGPKATLRFGHRTREELAGQPSAPTRQEIPLTARELEVARLAAADLTSEAIGMRLGISPRTVKTHLRNIYERVGVHSRLGLSQYLREHGQLEP
jgi:DNA-binding CsgD family transcriptional regulator